jgi:hypothetical protein
MDLVIGLHTADFMKRAIQLYGRLGFERSLKYDFEPANDGVIVKAFRLTICYLYRFRIIGKRIGLLLRE